MIDLSVQDNPRFQLSGLSGSVLMTDDPARTSEVSSHSMSKAVSKFQSQQTSHQFDNKAFEYQKCGSGLLEAAHAVNSNFDFEALHTLAKDPIQARRVAAMEIIQESIAPPGPQVPAMAPKQGPSLS